MVAADIAAFLAAERYRPDEESGSRSTRSGCGSRRSATCTASPAAPPPNSTAAVTETFAGLNRLARKAGQRPKPKLAAKIGILREIVAPIGDDLPRAAAAGFRRRLPPL